MMKRPSGFTLVEVLVSTLIFSIMIVGLLSVFVSANKLILHSRERMVSVQLGRFFLDPLQSFVRQDNWGVGNDLAVGGTSAQVMQNINQRSFTESHIVNNVAGTDLRRVVSNIAWTEPSS